MGLGVQSHAPAALPQGKKLGAQFIGGWVGPGTGLDGCGKSCVPIEIRSPDRPSRSNSLYGLR